MSKIRCIVIDDESIARTAIAGYVRKIDALELLGVFKNALEANDFLQQNEVDLLFLDIEMPQLSGIQFLRIYNKDIAVIFTTAYSKFAMESFDFNVIDYLLKPISFDRFLQGVNKAVRYFSNENSRSENNFLFIKEGTTLRKIIVSDINYIEAMQNYIRINLTNSSVMALMTLKEFMSQLPEKNFVQVHRSFVVNILKIEKIEEEKIWFGEKSIPISKRSKASFKKKLNEL